MKVAFYLRVSSAEQSTDNQLPALQAFAKTRGWEVAEVYSENATSWTAGHQKELARLLDDLGTGRRRYDYLLVWSLDRLTREGISSLLALWNHFRLLGCQIVSVKETWTEVPNEMTPIFLAMIGFFARWESDRRSERTKAGLDRVKAHGVKLGRPRGSKDQQKRNRAGYLLRWAGKQSSADKQAQETVLAGGK
jgi:putative DNA-invertase from lambdoid prophage Rac